MAEKTRVELVHAPQGVLRVRLPPGWVRVLTGPVWTGDRYLDCAASTEDCPRWERAPAPSDASLAAGEPYSRAGWYACLIRREVGAAETDGP